MALGLADKFHDRQIEAELAKGRAALGQAGAWKDTVAPDKDEEVEVILRWSGYRGRYLLHC